MKTTCLIVISVLAILLPCQGRARTVLAIRQPTIIILIDTPTEIEKHDHDDEYGEFSSDFAVYANRMSAALKQHPGIKVRWSSADAVTFPGTRFRAVMRKKLESSWGYVFYRPGRKPIVIAGVAVDDELVCTASQLYTVKVDGYNCDASN
jgi:hypothetical protein